MRVDCEGEKEKEKSMEDFWPFAHQKNISSRLLLQSFSASLNQHHDLIPLLCDFFCLKNKPESENAENVGPIHHLYTTRNVFCYLASPLIFM